MATCCDGELQPYDKHYQAKGSKEGDSEEL